MAYERFFIKPLMGGIDVSHPSLNASFLGQSWPSKNIKITQHSASKRWGYGTVYRDLHDISADIEIQAIVLYQEKGGGRSTLYLTPTDLIRLETASGKTWSYRTETITYATDVTSIANEVVTLTAGNPSTDGVADGDYFILVDDYTAAEETHRVVAYDEGDDKTGDTPETGDTVAGVTSGATGKIKLITVDGGSFAGGDASGDLILTTSKGTWIDDEPLLFKDKETALVNGTETNTWASIASVTSSTIVLDENYPGSTSAGFASDKTGYVRRVYTTPQDERWSHVIVDDKFIFTNGNTNVQYWDGDGYAEDLETTATPPDFAKNARYLTAYANRLFIADYGAPRDPLAIAWSKEGDPQNWTDDTSGVGILIETKDFITGLGVVGSDIVIYKADSIAFGHRTANPTTPISLPQTRERRGIGLVAPYGTIEFMGTTAFIGRNDFYLINSNIPIAIGGKIKDKFFSIVGKEEIKKVFGFFNDTTDELCWLVSTSEGKLCFAYDYKIKEWNVYEFLNDMTAGGRGIK